MSLHHQYINNESNSESPINEFEYLFKNYNDYPPSLKEALFDMFRLSGGGNKASSLYGQIMSKVNKHLQNKFSSIKKKYPNITYEDAQIITSYTCELNNEDYNYNPYKVLNSNLVSDDRKNGIRKISKYFFIFLKASRKLDRYYPDKNKKYLYRCISKQIELNRDSFDNKKIPYLKGEKKIFWAFSSASINPQTSSMFLGKDKNDNKTGTIFTLTGNIWGYDITLFNVFNEEEILLEPERKLLIKESIPPINNVIYVRCKVLDTPLILENIFKQNKVNNKPNLNFNIEENLNIGQIINEKNGKNEDNIKIFSSSTKNKDNIQNIKYNITNSETKSLKYSNLTFNNKIKKSKLIRSNSEQNLLKNKISNDKLNKIDNSNNIIPNKNNSNFSNHKKQFSVINKNQILNNNNFDSIKENNNNKKCLKSNYLNTDPNYDNNSYSLNNNNSKNKILSSSSSYNNTLSKSKFNTIDNDADINNKKSSNNILSNQLNDYEIIGDYNLSLNRKLPGARNTYYGINIKLNEEVAIKRELISNNNPLLAFEKNMYEQLKGGIGIPKLYWYGTQEDYNILIRELLDNSLEYYFKSCNNKFTLLTTLMLADQMLSRIEFIHSRNYIHGNIKPAQFLMGKGSKKNKVYITPFRGSKRYRDPITGLHIPYKERIGFRGTDSFASINQLKLNEISRRDDIEGLGYTLVYFLKGSFPWNNIEFKTDEERREKIKEIKMNSLDIICNGCPEEFMTFIQYSRDLKFEDRPDYVYLRNILSQIRDKNKLVFNYDKFDWLLKK